MEDLLFVYGTLLNDTNHEMAVFLEKESTYVGRGSFQGVLYNVGRYPGAVKDKYQEGLVYGNLIRLSEPYKVIKILDLYEGVGTTFEAPNEYRRELLEVDHEGEPLRAWVYLYNHAIEGLEAIESGDYLKYSVK